METAHRFAAALVLGVTALVAGCSADEAPAEEPPTGITPGDVHTDVVAHANLCKEEMGIPDAVLAPMNCLDGEEVLITVDGEPLNAEIYEQLAAGEVGCDTPSWFPGFECQNYAFVLRRTLAPDVEAVLICRSRQWRDHRSKEGRLAAYREAPTEEAYDTLFTFDSLGLIWTHTKTGKTCFFDYVGEVYGGYVPSPDDPNPPSEEQLPEPPPAAATTSPPLWSRGARDVWHRPVSVALVGRCAACHDSGPFIHTPWLNDLDVLPTIAPSVPYVVVGNNFALWHYVLRMWAVDTLPVPRPDGTEEAQVCTSCHRIGAAETCAKRIDYYTGKVVPPGTFEGAAGLAHRALMPPPTTEGQDLSAEAQQELWETLYGDHYEMLRCCCDNLGALGCTSQRLWFEPLGEPDVGPGPVSCYPSWFE